MTTKQDIKGWIEKGYTKGKRWMIVVCDTFDYEYYPVYACTVAEFDKAYAVHHNTNMQHITEVYDLDGDIEKQLDGYRAYSYPDQSLYNPNPNPSNAVIAWLEEK